MEEIIGSCGKCGGYIYENSTECTCETTLEVPQQLKGKPIQRFEDLYYDATLRENEDEELNKTVCEYDYAVKFYCQPFNPSEIPEILEINEIKETPNGTICWLNKFDYFRTFGSDRGSMLIVGETKTLDVPIPKTIGDFIHCFCMADIKAKFKE